MKNSIKAGIVMAIAILLPFSLDIALAGNERVELPNAVMQESGLVGTASSMAIPLNCINLRDCIENCSQIQNCSAYLNCIKNCTSNAADGFEKASDATPIDLLQSNESTNKPNKVLLQFDKMSSGGEMGGVPGRDGWADQASGGQEGKPSSGDIKIKEDYQVVKSG